MNFKIHTKRGAKFHSLAAQKVFEIEIDGLKAARKRLRDGDDFDQAVFQIIKALDHKKKIVVSGVGKSGLIARKIASTFTATGAPAIHLDLADPDLNLVAPGDIVILLSNSGESQELIELVPEMRLRARVVIAITGAKKSTLARGSDAVLNVKVPREACPFNTSPTTSTTAALCMGDALAMVTMEARGITKDDLKKNHPGGQIGKALR